MKIKKQKHVTIKKYYVTMWVITIIIYINFNNYEITNLNVQKYDYFA